MAPGEPVIAELSERAALGAIHARFLGALGSAVRSHSDVNGKPLEADLDPPLPHRVRIYVFNATRPPGGRPLGEHKIQLMLPGQARGTTGTFDNSDSRIVILAGYTAEEDVFILWDAGLYDGFAWSRNVQVKAETIVQACAGKVATQERRLRPTGGGVVVETLVAVTTTRLRDGLLRRAELTRNRLAGE